MENYNTTNGKTKEEEERYKQYQRQKRLDDAAADIAKLECDCLSVYTDKAVLKQLCADASAIGVGGLVVFPILVKTISGFLGDETKCSLIAAISYPTGADITSIKVNAVKRAFKEGAKEVEVCAPVVAIKDGNFTYLKKECKKLKRAGKNKGVRITLDCSMFTAEEVTKACAVIAEVGIGCIRLNRYPDAAYVQKILEIVNGKSLIKLDRVESMTGFENAVSLGANKVSCKSAVNLANEMLTKAST